MFLKSTEKCRMYKDNIGLMYYCMGVSEWSSTELDRCLGQAGFDNGTPQWSAADGFRGHPVILHGQEVRDVDPAPGLGQISDGDMRQGGWHQRERD